MSFNKAIFSIKTPGDFNRAALDIFHFQYQNNIIYRKFCDTLGRSPMGIRDSREIPFLPIEFFKTHEIKSSEDPAEVTFSSSGTGGGLRSKHPVTDIRYYQESFRRGFGYFYGKTENYAVLALLPSYLEREGSSLIYMARDMIERSSNRESGFYLNDLDLLRGTLKRLKARKQQIFLIGVSFALLELAENYPVDLSGSIVMETGGMKGRRKEMIREELHKALTSGFAVEKIHSEYGMTELLSQAYSRGEGIFRCPPWMKVLVRDPEDPITLLPSGKAGGINVIDLANVNSCSFIATQDLGKTAKDGTFEVLGRFDNSDIRGCNLMVL